MMANFNIYSVVLLLGVVQSVIYTTLLIVRGIRRRRLSDFLLGLLIFLAGIVLLPYMLGFMGIPVIWTTLLFFPTDPGLLLGPVVYFYLVSLTDNEFRFRKKHLWHLIPFLLFVIYRLIVFFQGKAFVQIWMEEVDIPFVRLYVEIATLASNYFYLFLTIKHYNHYRKWVETAYSNPDEISFSWYKNYLVLIAVVFTCSWVFSLLYTFGIRLTFTQNWWEYVFVTITIYILSIRGFQEMSPVLIHFPVKQEENNDSAATDMQDRELIALVDRLKHIMDEEKMYLNPDLCLRDVVLRLGLPTSVVSQAINMGFGKNFSQFVNHYRIAAFKRKATDPLYRHLSLLAIAMDSGFNSKATFNRVFRQATGLSPRDFLSNHNPGANPSEVE
ncbi:MAG: AraC family transcriptional regulator [Bacteroidia bacterium]